MNAHEPESEVSLSEMLHIILRKKIVIAVWGVLFALISLAVAIYLPDQYKSQATLVVAKDPNEGLGAISSNFSGLAGLAGMNLQSGQAARNAMIAKELLKSKAFITDFIREQSIEVPLLAAIEWDKSTEQLVIDPDIYDKESKTWLVGREGQETKGIQPLETDLYRAFMDIFSMNEDPKTGAINMSVEFYAPVMTRDWLKYLIDKVNNYIKLRDQQQTRKNIEYLNELAAKTPNSSLKETFYNLIEEQTKTLMLAELQDEYVFQIIDPPDLPEKKSAPKRALILIVGTFMGLVLTVLFILSRAILKSESAAKITRI